MLHDGKWSRGREKLVQQMHRAMAEDALKSGLSVIVDDTNLAPKHEDTYRQMAERHGAEFEVKDFDISVEECIERDNNRPDHVGKDVILRMFYESKCSPKRPHIPSAPTALIFDIDGTLARMKDRGPFEWSKVGNDELNVPVAVMLDCARKMGIKILLVSGRDAVCRPETIAWLSEWAIEYDDLWMRPEGSNEKDTIVKRRIYEEEIVGKYNVHAVFDDRPCVVRFWRSQGLFVFDCGNGVEF